MKSSTLRPDRRGRDGFTLVELLIVIFIIALVSAAALPTVLPAINHREVSEAARTLQGALVGARDAAIHDNAPRGIRLLPDPNFNGINPTTQILDGSRILACNRIVPIQQAPDYSEGYLSIVKDTNLTGYPFPAGVPQYPQPPGSSGHYPYPDSTTAGFSLAPKVGVLMVEQSPLQFDGINSPTPNPPTSWFWNVRVGDKIRVASSGRLYTVIGPLTVNPLSSVTATKGNPELFVNDGLPGSTPQLQRTYNFTVAGNPVSYTLNVEYLFLVDGTDNNGDGVIDGGWDGLDNNGDTYTDEIAPNVGTVGSEWEVETWDDTLSAPPVVSNPQIYNALGNPVNNAFLNLPYSIIRRPIPSPNQKEVPLPSNVVIDLTGWNLASPERSRVGPALNQFTGYVDILVSPQGDIVPSSPYATPASFGMANSFMHFWLAERSDLNEPVVTGNAPRLPLPTGLYPASDATGRQIKGEFRIVTLFTRSGNLVTNETTNFDTANVGTANYNASYPFLQAQRGGRGSQ